MLDQRRVAIINQGWGNALKVGASVGQCQSALIGQFLHHRPVKMWPGFEPWYSGPAQRELVGKNQLYFDVVCDSIEKVLRREAMDLIDGRISEEESTRNLQEHFPDFDIELLVQLRDYSVSDLSGRLN